MLHEHVELFKRTFVEQKLDALARRELALGVLGFHALGAASGAGCRSLGFEGCGDFLHGRLILLKEENLANQAEPAQAQVPVRRGSFERRKVNGRAYAHASAAINPPKS
jgi:hypothetical protein